MTDLLETVIEAHGGLERWNQLDAVSAHLVQGGPLWALKCQQGVLDDVFVRASLHQELESHHPFGAPDRRSAFAPQRGVIETTTGDVIEALEQPRASFAGHILENAVDHSATGLLRRRHRDVDVPHAAVHLRAAGIQDD